ncbi:hypothetical protein BMS3Bbin02_00148 [bacterium BMS3Bbin02]|nr:hypothetical protein BMS3Bbin02_00148 [bacterium BMS3Bbin02]
MKRTVASLFVIAFLAAPVAAQAQTQAVNCGTYRNVTCAGPFTDQAGFVDNDERATIAIESLIADSGNEIAVVIVDDVSPESTKEFANNLAETWGVGSSDRNDGIVIVVAIAQRETWVTTGDGVSINETAVSDASVSFFRNGDFDGGVLAMLSALRDELGVSSAGTAEPQFEPTPDTGPAGLPRSVLWTAVGLASALVGVGTASAISTGRKQRRRVRKNQINTDLRTLEVTGAELPQLATYRIPAPPDAPTISTGTALDTLYALSGGYVASDERVLHALWNTDLIEVVDTDRLLMDTAIPLELAASGERAILEDSLNTQLAELADAYQDSNDAWNVRRDSLLRLIASLRPHRVAAARKLFAENTVASTVETPVGQVLLVKAGRRFLESGPVLMTDDELTTSLDEVESAYTVASAKARAVRELRDTLDDSPARPGVAAALADIGAPIAQAQERFLRVRSDLGKRGKRLENDNLDLDAIAALLIMNNDERSIDDFTSTYGTLRDSGHDAPTSVEMALAGLRTPKEVERVRAQAAKLGIPISIAAALLRRKEEGIRAYKGILDRVLTTDIPSERATTIAGILAISLEPAVAVDNWHAARTALGELGLAGSYADVAAAFGASDPRGPRAFALAYVAQRRALIDEGVEDADRFAPELAHAGTSGQRDSWTGQPIPRSLGNFDPFTLFYYHWIVTKGRRGSYGWEPIYADTSWADTPSGGWTGWSGGGGFWSSGGGGGSSWGGGSFGGFGGGGGFSGGGGSGW